MVKFNSHILKRLTFFLLISSLSSQVFPQFKASMENVKSGNKEIYTVYSDKTQYRYDFVQDNQKMIIIVKPQINKTIILLPDKKFYIQQACDGMNSRRNDPVQSYISMKKDYTEKNAGKENVEGFTCNKKEIYADNDKIITAWFAESLNFPVKMVNHLYENTYMNLKDIQKWKVDPAFFEIPSGYTEVDERMRPVIPEPPAPKKWTTKSVQLPFQSEVSRGTLLIFSINKEAHYKMIAENKTDKPAKIIRYSFRDGKELSEKIQGPEKYRTSRLYPGEKVPGTFIWKEGQEIRIKVFEGTISLIIREE